MTRSPIALRRAETDNHTPWSLLTMAGLGAWLLVTAASQHPNQMFDRLREYDRTGLFIPNWRFFAPEPSRHDFHVLHRALTADGEQTPWRETTHFSPRVWAHAIYFPAHRREKAIFDICRELIVHLQGPDADVTPTVGYRVLRDFVERAVREEFAGRPLPRGFQFTIARHTGHDSGLDPEYILISPFETLTAGTWEV